LFNKQFKPRSFSFGVFYFGQMISKIFAQFLKVRYVTTDTRNIPQQAIFFALKGDRFNGNTFAAEALAAGASMVVIDEADFFIDDRTVLVDDVLGALQAVALEYRRTFDIPFIGITGSNGKTTTKELMRDVLKKGYKVHATKGNLNNHIGVPLTLLSMPADTTLAIIEMGANHQKEIEGYCTYALPTHGLITNIGKAHLEGFGGEEGVYKGKRELFVAVSQRGGTLFVNPELPRMAEASDGMKAIHYGFRSGDLQLNIQNESPTLEYSSVFNGKESGVKTQLAGAYNLYNVASAIVVGRYFGIAEDQIHDAIAAYQPDNNRSQWHKTGRNDLILDAYNANPSSMEHALNSFAKQDHANKIFILGDMRELGDASPAEHKSIFQLAQSLELKGIWIGEWFKKLAESNGQMGFSDVPSAMEYVRTQAWKGQLILIKGSRGIQLENLVPLL
jgi:UDP-N-acetylmuramoyl-tripeptide--D-alanyl-D-alanine ligase